MYSNINVTYRFYTCTTIILRTFEIKYIQKQNLEGKRTIIFLWQLRRSYYRLSSTGVSIEVPYK